LSATIFYATTYEPIGFFDLSVRLRVRHLGKLQLYVKLVAVLLELSRGEVGAIICDDTMGHAKEKDDRVQKVYRGRFLGCCNWFFFNPLGKLMDYN
jgi:hypothetical protein